MLPYYTQVLIACTTSSSCWDYNCVSSPSQLAGSLASLHASVHGQDLVVAQKVCDVLLVLAQNICRGYEE
jgi:hypothetical protein